MVGTVKAGPYPDPSFFPYLFLCQVYLRRLAVLPKPHEAQVFFLT